jgi:BlaI family transcriptional regulator, penicillinase repressor
MISAAESLVMEMLWGRNPLTADDIVEAIADEQNWSAATVRTLLNRLLTKGAVSATREGRRYLYAPILAREDYVSAESQNLLDRLFGGRVGPLMSHFSAQQKLTPEDIAELKRLIEELDSDA